MDFKQKMYTFPADIFRCIVARQELALMDIVAISLVCRRFHDWGISYLTEAANTGIGYPLRTTLVQRFTCYCGRKGLDVRHQCECFVNCYICKRDLPERLTVRMDFSRKICCGFPCETECTSCCRKMYKENVGEFSFIRGDLRCNECPIRWTSHCYAWIHRCSKKIYSLFADELKGADNGPIPWNRITKYDPGHRILALLP